MKNYDTALTLLEKAYEKRDLALHGFKIDPVFDPIRNEPRFKALLKNMHLH